MAKTSGTVTKDKKKWPMADYHVPLTIQKQLRENQLELLNQLGTEQSELHVNLMNEVQFTIYKTRAVT